MAQEITFSRKIKKVTHPSLRFNNCTAWQAPHQKHVDVQLTFEECLKVINTKLNKIIQLFGKLQSILPRMALMTIYKGYVRPHINYGGVTYDKAYNEKFQQKLQSIQYNACLALSAANK